MSPEAEQPIIIHPELQGEVDAQAAPPRVRVETRSVGRRAEDYTRRDDGAEPSPAPPELASADPKRAFSLDALRGLFLISMTMGFTIWSDSLPAWMYHRQMPPGDAIVDIPGISWRDLAYGAFLFTMAAALPLTFSRRVDKGETEIAIVVAAVRRYLMLLFYALLVAHSNTYFLGYSQTTRLLAVVGFVIMAMVFTRRRRDWNERTFTLVNRAGWALAVAFLALSPLVYGKTFSFSRIDDIIAGLAFASLTGIIIWYFTRDNLTARFAVLALAVAAYLGAKGDGFVAQWWWDWPASWAFEGSRFVLLAVVVPGTIAGDLLLRWMREAHGAEDAAAWSPTRSWALVALTAAVPVVVVVGLYNRWVQPTFLLALAIVVAGLFVTLHPRTPIERLLRSLFVWASMWLVIGLLLEPFEGGIKKVPDTLSYFFTVTGTTMMLLVLLTAVIDSLHRRRWVNALIDVGHNPLLTYVLYTVLLNSALELIPVTREFMRQTPWLSVLRSMVEVVIVVLTVRAVSRRRIYWRT
ncbi:MAG TPA: DUF5009 domain-containing protein [Gemmatimonadaceae bacterium]|nr:DUF5009 domain-containing protein [Gemmatimonadaceae bacterium]